MGGGRPLLEARQEDSSPEAPSPFSADSTEAPKPKSSPEQPSGQGRTRAVTQVRVLAPEDDLASMLLQVRPLLPGTVSPEVGAPETGRGFTPELHTCTEGVLWSQVPGPELGDP